MHVNSVSLPSHRRTACVSVRKEPIPVEPPVNPVTPTAALVMARPVPTVSAALRLRIYEVRAVFVSQILIKHSVTRMCVITHAPRVPDPRTTNV